MDRQHSSTAKMMKHLKQGAGAFLLMAGATTLSAKVAVPGFELVHTTPVGTDLHNPDIREPVAVWCEMIDRARHSIDFEQFYAASKPGEPLDAVIAHIQAAAKRGVRIRFLMEEKGVTLSDAATLDRLKAIPGIDFRLLDYSAVSGDGIIHAKFFLVDDRAAYVGSQNFDWRSLKHIDETGLKIDDAAIVNELAAIFAQDWRAQVAIAAGQTAPRPASDKLLPTSPNHLVASPAAFDPPGVGDSQQELVRRISEAQHDLRIEVMNYAPLDQHHGYYDVIDRAIRAAAQRGVQVRMLVADWSLTKERLPYLKSLAILPNVQIRVVTIPAAPEGFIPFARVIHTKTMTIDGRIAWIGTSNWEGGYLDNSRNLEVVLRNEVMAKRVGALHDQLWTSRYAQPLDIGRDYPAPHPGSEQPIVKP